MFTNEELKTYIERYEPNDLVYLLGIDEKHFINVMWETIQNNSQFIEDVNNEMEAEYRGLNPMDYKETDSVKSIDD